MFYHLGLKANILVLIFFYQLQYLSYILVDCKVDKLIA